MSQFEFKNIDPPFWVAWHQAKASIRVRFLRMAITTIGIALGIAFFCSMQTLSLAEATIKASGGSQRTWLVSTSLVMCLVGVTNSMLMSVGERYREIGTIKCLGASDGFVVKVFFLEAMLLGIVGAAIGSFLGAFLMAAVVARMGMPIPILTVCGIFGIGVVIGSVLTVLAAIAPAIQAARMPAAAALRVEI